MTSSELLARRNLPLLLLRARESALSFHRPALRKYGLSDQQWRVLRVLAECGVLETGRLAHETLLAGASLTGIIDRMERGGLVRRKCDQKDKRCTLVEATPIGTRLARQLSPSIESSYGSLEASLGRQNLASLYVLLDEVVAAMEKAPGLR